MHGESSLAGFRFLIPRPRSQAHELQEGLQRLGAEAICIPTIRIEPPSSWEETDAAIAALNSYEWVAFTSQNAVRFFADRAEGRGAREALARKKIAAVGPSTVQALEERGLRADLRPRESLARAVAQELHDRGEVSGRRFLLPRGEIAREDLPRQLAHCGGEVRELTVYRTLSEPSSRDPLRAFLKEDRAAVLLFTSGSTVRHFAALAGADMMRRVRSRKVPFRVASIGPVTSATVREVGLSVDFEAQEHSAAGLLKALAVGLES